MSDDLITDLEGLMTAFKVGTLEDFAEAIDEAADIDDGRDPFIDARGDEVFLGIGTRDIEIEFPTTREAVLALAAEVEQLQDDIPFRVIPGHPSSDVIIHVPHASRHIPEDVRDGILLDDEELDAELDAMTDAFTDVIAEHAASQAKLRPWIFVNQTSRLVVDPERFPDDREEMNAVGMGVVYTRTSAGAVLRRPADDEVSELVNQFFAPYADGLAELAAQRMFMLKQVTIIDLHSYPRVALPYELHGDGPRPEICFGTDQFHTPDAIKDAAQEAFTGFEVGLDSPFSGCYVPTAQFGVNRRVRALMIEIRRDLYLDQDFALVEEALAPIVSALTAIIDVASPQVFPASEWFGDPNPLQSDE